MAQKGQATEAAIRETEDKMPEELSSNGTLHRLTVEHILAQQTVTKRTIEVPEWGGTVTIQGLSKKQQQDIRKEAMVDGEVDSDLVTKATFREAVVDPQFTPEQVVSLWEHQAGVIDGILMAVLRLSGMDAEALKRWERLFRD